MNTRRRARVPPEIPKLYDAFPIAPNVVIFAGECRRLKPAPCRKQTAIAALKRRTTRQAAHLADRAGPHYPFRYSQLSNYRACRRLKPAPPREKRPRTRRLSAALPEQCTPTRTEPHDPDKAAHLSDRAAAYPDILHSLRALHEPLKGARSIAAPPSSGSSSLNASLPFRRRPSDI